MNAGGEVHGTDAGRSWRAPILVLVAVGVALRAGWLFSGRSLWHDEAMLALNVLTRPFVGLFTAPLDLNQTAPPLYLAVLWLASRLGEGEVGLRAASFIAGVIALLLFVPLSRRYLPPAAQVLAVTMFALSAPLIGYSAEVKPYAWDLLAAVGMTLLCLRGLPVTEGGRVPAPALLAGCLVAVGVASAPFTLGAAGLALALGAARGRRPAQGRTLVAAGVGWALLFLLVWVLLYRPVAHAPSMQRFWAAAFLDAGDPIAAWRLHRRWLSGLLIPDENFALLPGYATVLTALLLWGGLAIWRRLGAVMVVALAGSLCLAYGANVLRLYPFDVRLMLFAAPAVVILLASGLESLAAAAGRLRRPLFAIGAFVILLPFGTAILTRTPPGMLEEVRPLLRDGPLSASDDPLYVFGKAGPAWLYYTAQWKGDGRGFAQDVIAMARALGPTMGNRPSRGDSVRTEGDEFLLDAYGRRVLLGVPSGYEAVFRTTWDAVSVDPGWGQNEARRLAGLGTDCVFVLFAHYKPVEARSVQLALEASGARRVYIAEPPGAELSRYCWRKPVSGPVAELPQ